MSVTGRAGVDDGLKGRVGFMPQQGGALFFFEPLQLTPVGFLNRSLHLRLICCCSSSSASSLMKSRILVELRQLVCLCFLELFVSQCLRVDLPWPPAATLQPGSEVAPVGWVKLVTSRNMRGNRSSGAI